MVRLREADALEKITVERPDLLQSHETRLLRRVASLPQQEVGGTSPRCCPASGSLAASQPLPVRNLHQYLEDDSRIVKTFAMQALADLARDDEKLPRRVTP